MHPGQYVYIYRKTYDIDGDRNVNQKMMAKITKVTMPKYSALGRSRRGNLTFEMPNGRVADLKEEVYGGYSLTKAFMDELMKTPQLSYEKNNGSEIFIEFYGDEFYQVKLIMESIQKEHEAARSREEKRKAEQLRSEQEALRLEQERQHLNRESEKGLDDMFRQM